MADLLIQVEDDMKEKLRLRACSHGRSTEEEVREIIRNVVESDDVKREGLGTRLAARFRGIGLDQEIPELRGYPAKPADFDDQ